MADFESILYLDDVRVPASAGIDLVRNYDEFVEYLQQKGMPDLISFDHDLAREHYPTGENTAGRSLPYSKYREKTGFHCARFIIENRLPLRHWAVHSLNVQGRINIERELRRYHRRGEVRGLQIPFEVEQPEKVIVPAARRRRFSSTSLFQFEEDIALESWERSAFRDFVRG